MADTTDAPNKAELILEAAQELFTQLGFRRTSMDDVARRAGVAKGTLYLYFDNKAAVFRAMQQRNFDRADERCDAAEAKGRSFEARLAGVLAAYYGWMHEHYGASEHLAELGQTRVLVGRDLAEDHDRRYSARLAGLIRRGTDEGELTLDRVGMDEAQVAAAILDAARGAKAEASKPVTPAQYNAALKRIARVISAGLVRG
ncbi:MAG TPA: helix-turn-helix domain-containing protein [Phenylobacterium sp.]